VLIVLVHGQPQKRGVPPAPGNILITRLMMRGAAGKVSSTDGGVRDAAINCKHLEMPAYHAGLKPEQLDLHEGD